MIVEEETQAQDVVLLECSSLYPEKRKQPYSEPRL